MVTCHPHPRGLYTLHLVAVEMTTWWSTSSGALCLHPPVQGQGGESSWVWGTLSPRRRVPQRACDRPAEDAGTRPTHSPESSTWERAGPAPPLNAGAPSSEPPVNDGNTDERDRERRGGDEDDDGEEMKKEEKKKKGDGCLTDSSFEEINRLTPATIASVEGHNLSS